MPMDSNGYTMLEKINTKIRRLRQTRPLIHCITNQVSMNLVANSLLALGASPIMSSHAGEVEEIAGLAAALYLNIGTLNSQTLPVMLGAGQAANARNLPVVLDPVGAGATALRNQACARLLNEIKISAIRGNASEIRALASIPGASHGVDAAHKVEEAYQAADMLARRHGLIVALTGVSDYVTNGVQNIAINGGHGLMAMVSGMGCAVGGLLAAWLSMERGLEDAAELLFLAGQCGANAGAASPGPGSFAPMWLDELHRTGQ